MDDKRIAALLHKRDEKALACIAEKYGGLIRKLVSNILSDAEDVQEAVNDTYMHIWEASVGTMPVHLCAYICRIAKNTALKRARYNSAAKRAISGMTCIDELAEILPDTREAEKACDETLLTAVLDDFLQELPVQKRTVFVKRYWFYEPVEEIAAETGLKKGTVSTMLFRLRGELKEKLKEEGWLYE